MYGRVKEDGGRIWLQYWLWCYYNPKHLLGFGKHEGDWEVVQIGLDAATTPEVATYSQHENGEARDWDKARRQGDHPIVYVAPLSHACYFEPGAHPYVFGVDNPDDTLAPGAPQGRGVRRMVDAGPGAGARHAGCARRQAGRPQPRQPRPPGPEVGPPGGLARTRAKAATPLRQSRGVVAAGRQGDVPKLTGIDARREGDRVLVDYQLDPAIQRRATRLLVTLHRADEDELCSPPAPSRCRAAPARSRCRCRRASRATCWSGRRPTTCCASAATRAGRRGVKGTRPGG